MIALVFVTALPLELSGGGLMVDEELTAAAEDSIFEDTAGNNSVWTAAEHKTKTRKILPTTR